MSKSVKRILFIVGGIFTLIGAVLYIAAVNWEYVPYLYAGGCAGIAVVYLTNVYRGKNTRIRRLHGFLAAAGILLVASSYFMFHHKQEWIICVAVSAVLQIYASFTMPGKNDETE
ncbi:MAG: DUF2157 domain-containing protein [Candidatus Azobacteroides sp.]|nr:DUF2157 domain-containing protein [Candidatus Azobacteroides sp.]